MRNISYFLSLLIVVAAFDFAEAQRRKRSKTSVQTVSYPSESYDAMKWRFIGTHRGGRASGVCGVPGQPNVYYQAATGGGIWKTTDGGNSWQNISDGYFGGSMGAVRVSEYDPNIIYAGCGEKTVRGNVSPGYGGVYKSYDAGKTWESVGLSKLTQIGEIRIHPKNPDIVFVAVIGDLFKDSPNRGVYKTIDGGKTWNKVLYANASAGAVDITFDPNNARILYASTWNIRRTPYSLSSGGEGSALWKSTDMGETWTNISDKPGLPKGTLGIIGVSVSAVNSDRVYAMVEAKKGGLFRSDDAGETWKLVSEDRNLRQRAWYYTKVFADTQNEDRVYVMNVRFWQSNDGGKTFKSYSTPHGDHHDLWINPDNNNILAVADDGGAQISYDAAENWTTYRNQATAQYYRITADNAFPYRLYVAQQDNSTQRIPHRTTGRSINESHWESTAGGESAHIAPDPKNPDIVYGGSYDGFLSRKDHSTDETRQINVWPDNPMGHGAEGMKYRFQWNFPIFFSPHDQNKLYTTSNQFHVTTDEGQSWQIISPDLTRNEADKLVSSGGPITQDNTSVEYYATIFAACESPYEEGLFWAASDDGLVHVSRDGGANWQNVTPPSAPKYLMWNSVDPDPHTKGGVYLAGTLYKAGDFKPYLFKSKDYGQTWTKITTGIPNDHFTRVVRADPGRKGLLYAGTEFGAYISFDDGASWGNMQLNLPITPITDMIVKNNNLALSTQGRGVYIMDDLTVFHQLSSNSSSDKISIAKPIDSYRMGSFNGGKPPRSAGQNHHNGVEIFFNVNKELSGTDTVTLDIMEMDGSIIRTVGTRVKDKKDSITVKKGSNSFKWNMQYKDAEGFDGMIMWWASLTGPKAVPGTYKARLSLNGESVETEFNILADPRSKATQADLQEQFDFVQAVNAKVTETHQAIKDIRKVRKQLGTLESKMDDDTKYKSLKEQIKAIKESMKAVEQTLYQTKNRSGQDPLNFPIRLNNKLAHVKVQVANGNYKPTDQAYQVRDELSKQIDEQLDIWQKIREEEIPKLNQSVYEMQIDAIQLKEEKIEN